MKKVFPQYQIMFLSTLLLFDCWNKLCLNSVYWSHTILFKYSNPWLEVLPGLLPVLLNAQIVDQRRPAGGYQEVDDGDEGAGGKMDQDEADSLQKPVEHVELHRDKIPSLPPSFCWAAEAINPFILHFPKPKNNLPNSKLRILIWENTNKYL